MNIYDYLNPWITRIVDGVCWITNRMDSVIHWLCDVEGFFLDRSSK